MERKYKKLVLEKTEGVLETVTDLVLAEIFFGWEFGKRPTMTAVDRGKAHLAEINYETIRKTIENLRGREWIKGKGDALELTEKGLAKLERVVLIDGKGERRNGEIYLIIYDISNDEANWRNKLRKFLLRSRMVKVQESVYLSPFDPRNNLEEFLRDNKISGQILVTKLGKDSVIGGEGIRDFLRRIYQLDELEKKYGEFVKKFGERGGVTAVFAFNRIYKMDPRLPVEFLPKDWVGALAMDVYQKALNRESSRCDG